MGKRWANDHETDGGVKCAEAWAFQFEAYSSVDVLDDFMRLG